MDTVEFDYRGQRIAFAITNPIDVIQRRQATGVFYAQDELEKISAHIHAGAEILDIGTNIGNHAVWFAKVLGARKVWLFEPNPEAIAVLRQNIALNGIAGQVVTDHLGIGLSDVAADGYSIRFAPKNMGGARMFDKGGELEVRRGDDVVGAALVDFIKIDVERMEMKVLAGLAETFARCRPPLFIEIDIDNEAAFETWRAEHRYRAIDRRQQVKRNATYLCVPEN